MPFGIVVLVSGTGTLLQALIDRAAADEELSVLAVVSDRAGVQALERADRVGVPTLVHPLGAGADRAAWDADLTEQVARFSPDLVVSAGFMKLLGTGFLSRFGGRTINSHPALLPSFPGMHGVRDALAYGVKVSGATVFMVDEGVDSGRILAQVAVPVHDDDTEATLHERIKGSEQQLLVDTVVSLARAAERASAHATTVSEPRGQT